MDKNTLIAAKAIERKLDQIDIDLEKTREMLTAHVCFITCPTDSEGNEKTIRVENPLMVKRLSAYLTTSFSAERAYLMKQLNDL